MEIYWRGTNIEAQVGHPRVATRIFSPTNDMELRTSPSRLQRRVTWEAGREGQVLQSIYLSIDLSIYLHLSSKCMYNCIYYRNNWDEKYKLNSVLIYIQTHTHTYIYIYTHLPYTEKIVQILEHTHLHIISYLSISFFSSMFP